MSVNNKIYKALTIAGSDSGGGAGIQADLKTFSAFGIYGTSVITALTAQNTIAVQSIYDVSHEFVGSQIDAIMSDIGTDAAKTGMLSNANIIKTVCEKVKKYNITNLVIDPVMVATSGDLLLQKDAVMTLKDDLLKLGAIVTPNLAEAEVLAGLKISKFEDVKEAARRIYSTGCKSVLVKGFLRKDNIVDFFYDGSQTLEYSAKYIDTKNTHGTGCTLSSAITSELAKGQNIENAINNAKRFMNIAIENSLNIGEGAGPLNHFVKWRR